jgi:hypothetical protein
MHTDGDDRGSTVDTLPERFVFIGSGSSLRDAPE